MTLEDRIRAFAILGESISAMIEENNEELFSTCKTAEMKNPWFTKENILHALNGICLLLNKQDLEKWASQYKVKNNCRIKQVATIMAGNIPLVGFHDLLCVLISGYTIKIKLSSKDDILPWFIIRQIIKIEPRFTSTIICTDGTLTQFDAAIATGSDSSSQYFDLYFKKFPSIIRRNRHSVAVLDGNESKTDIEKLGTDIFSYYGHGCRNVSKLYVPKNYDFNNFFPLLEKFKQVGLHHKYANNYDYYKAIYLMGKELFYDNGFMLLKFDQGLGSPISVVLFEYYNDINQLALNLEEKADTLQCIVSNLTVFHLPSIRFGNTQSPGLSDYADNVDTMAFLQNL